MNITLPYPPSTNTYWRNYRGRMVIGKKGREYRQAVTDSVTGGRLDGRLDVVVNAYMPDRRRRDLDNILKALLDAMQNAGVYDDDSQIDKLTVIRAGVEPPGRVEVALHESSDGR